jgi:hypothetical protein
MEPRYARCPSVVVDHERALAGVPKPRLDWARRQNQAGVGHPDRGTTRLYTGAVGEPCAVAPKATQTFAVAQLIRPIAWNDCPSKFGAPLGTENVTFDQVAPPSVVPNINEESASPLFPICWETDSDPDTQHTFGLGHDKPVKLGPGTSAGIGSKAQLFPPFVVDTSLGTEPTEPDGLIEPMTEQSSTLAHDSCSGRNPAGKTCADHCFPSSVVRASTLEYRPEPGPGLSLVPTTVHRSALEHAIDGIYKPV